MFVWFRVGVGLYGRIDRAGGTCIATRFFHLNGAPVVPLGSVLVLHETATDIRAVPIGWNVRSLLAAVGRFWGFFALGALALFALDEIESLRRPWGSALLVSVVTWAALLGYLALFHSLGRLSRDAHAQRMVYLRHANTAADVALLGEEAGPIRQTLHARLNERIRTISPQGYRDGHASWVPVAQDPSVHDVAFLGDAMTLARFDWDHPDASARAQMRGAHAAVWARLRTLDPSWFPASETDRRTYAMRPLYRTLFTLLPIVGVVGLLGFGWFERFDRVQRACRLRNSSYRSYYGDTPETVPDALCRLLNGRR